MENKLTRAPKILVPSKMFSNFLKAIMKITAENKLSTKAKCNEVKEDISRNWVIKNADTPETANSLSGFNHRHLQLPRNSAAEGPLTG